jgi:SagB-type dehydrogenase family enzyme
VTTPAAPLLRSMLSGSTAIDLDDPAERFHESSKLYPALGERDGQGIARLVASPALQALSAGPGRENPQLPAIELEVREPPPASLWSTLAERRSRRPEKSRRLEAGTLATLLSAAYGPSGPRRRTAPSGGALYPLELYLVAQRVTGVPEGVFHVDPTRSALELLDSRAVAQSLAAVTPVPDLLADTAAVIFLTAVFWRTRFKYGLRGYRFALLEAGHAAQNLLLAATALDVPALPLGGFFDARVEELLGADGVDESVLYGIALGGTR